MSRRPVATRLRLRRTPAALLTLGAAYLIGSVPTANAVARLVAHRDLRDVGTGTVSATNVYRVAGMAPFLAAAALDVSKGAVAVALVGRRSGLAAVVAGLAVAGHNWSPFLRWAGGRGVLPSVGALLVSAPSGAALITGGLVIGHCARDTAPACFVTQVMLVPVLAATHGRRGAALGAAVAVPMIVKRLAGNRPLPPDAPFRAYLTRLIYDRDTR